MCPYPTENMKFLQAIHHSIILSFPWEKERVTSYLRVNLVVGAKTGEHTDTLKGATPNFIAIEPGYSFELRIRTFPTFRDSMVEYNEELYIPHVIGPAEFVMIGLKDGSPHYFKFPIGVIDKVKPVGNLTNILIIGIKEKKLQTTGTEYSVHMTTASLPLKTWSEVLCNAKANPAKKPYKIFTYLKNQHDVCRWHKFYGWRNAHRWQVGSDHMCRRIHVFYRPIREETASARLRTAQNTKMPLNYTNRF